MTKRKTVVSKRRNRVRIATLAADVAALFKWTRTVQKRLDEDGLDISRAHDDLSRQAAAINAGKRAADLAQEWNARAQADIEKRMTALLHEVAGLRDHITKEVDRGDRMTGEWQSGLRDELLAKIKALDAELPHADLRAQWRRNGGPIVTGQPAPSAMYPPT